MNRPKSKARPLLKQREEKILRRWAVQLIVSLGILAGLGLGFRCFPVQTQACREVIAQLLSGRDQATTAFLRLGEELSQGENLPGAVQDWCISVFAPVREAAAELERSVELWP